VWNCVYVSIITNVWENLSLCPDIFNVNKIRLCKFSPAMKDNNETMLLIITTCSILGNAGNKSSHFTTVVYLYVHEPNMPNIQAISNVAEQSWIHSSCTCHWHKTYSIKNLFSRKNGFMNLLGTHISPEMHTTLFTYIIPCHVPLPLLFQAGNKLFPITSPVTLQCLFCCSLGWTAGNV
jgi:hypothetical protein